MTYKLIDGLQRHEANPNTFEIPSLEEKQELKAGDIVKLGFEATEEFDDGPSGERMWVRTTKIKGDDYEGTLSNDPVVIEDLKHGDKVIFNSKHIISIYEPE